MHHCLNLIFYLFNSVINVQIVESWYDEVHLFTGIPSNVQFSSLSGVGHFTQVKILHVQFRYCNNVKIIYTDISFENQI